MRGWLNRLRLRIGLKTEAEMQYDYLAAATDRIDLERRQRDIDRGTWR